MIPTATRCPGVLSVVRDHAFGFVRWDAPSVYVPLLNRLDDWKSQRHLAVKSEIDRQTREALHLILPDDEVPATRRLDSAMARATPLVVVPDPLRLPLLERGVRIWTVGYHRNPALFRIVGEGGGQPSLWIEQTTATFFNDTRLATAMPFGPEGRPPDVPWEGWYHDFAMLDRVVQAASGGVLDEPSILLADHLDRSGWGNLNAPEDERQKTWELIVEIDADPQKAEELHYSDLRWQDVSRQGFRDDEDRHRTSALEAVAEELASADGPHAVEITGIGAFFREHLPPLDLCLATPDAHEGWLPPLHGPRGTPHAHSLRLASTHRYVRHLGPGAWWEI